MLDEKSCELLLSSSSMSLNWFSETTFEMKELYAKHHGKSKIVYNGKVYKTWEDKYLENEDENLKKIEGILNSLFSPINIKSYFTSCGMMSIAKRYRTELYSTLDIYDKLGVLLLNTPYSIGMNPETESESITNSIRLNMMFFGRYAPLREWYFNSVKRGLGLFFKTKYKYYPIQDLRWWWALVDNQDVSQYYVDLYQTRFGLTQKQFASKVRNFAKRNSNILTQIPLQETKLKDRLSDLRLL